jgi:hypothetical protein
MDAKHLAALLVDISTLLSKGELTIEMFEKLNGSLWELAAAKGIREEVFSILQERGREEMGIQSP